MWPIFQLLTDGRAPVCLSLQTGRYSLIHTKQNCASSAHSPLSYNTAKRCPVNPLPTPTSAFAVSKAPTANEQKSRGGTDDSVALTPLAMPT